MENGLISEEAAEKLFGGLTDEEIIAQIKDNEDDIAMYYLISKYRKFVRGQGQAGAYAGRVWSLREVRYDRSFRCFIYSR